MPTPTNTPTPTPTPTPRYTLTTKDEDPYYKQFIEVEGVTVKAAAHVDPAALQLAAHMIDVMLDGREDIPECMADAGAGMLIIPIGDPMTSLPEYAHLKGGKDPLLGRSYDDTIRGLGGSIGLPNASTDEGYLLWTPPDPEVTAHEYAHSIHTLCFTSEDNARWNDFYDTARQANVFPGAYSMLTVYEFWAVLSNVYLGADRIFENGHRYEVRSILEREVPGVWEFLEEIYGLVITPTPEPGLLYVRYGIENGEAFPWRTQVGGTYEDDELGFSIDVPPAWYRIPDQDRHPDLAAVLRHPQGGYLDISATPLPNRNSLRSFAERIRDGMLEWTAKNFLMFEIDSFQEMREEGREFWYMTYRQQGTAEHCLEEGTALITLSSQYGQKPNVFVLRGTTCEVYLAYEFQRRDLLDMIASFR